MGYNLKIDDLISEINRLKTENEIHKSVNEKLLAEINNMGYVISQYALFSIIIDSNENIVYENNINIYYTEKSILGNTIENFFENDEYSIFKSAIELVKADNNDIKVNISIKKFNELKDLKLTISKLNINDTTNKYLIIANEIEDDSNVDLPKYNNILNESKNSINLVSNKESMLDLIIKSTSIMLLLYDISSKYRWANKAWENNTGFKAEEINYEIIANLLFTSEKNKYNNDEFKREFTLPFISKSGHRLILNGEIRKINDTLFLVNATNQTLVLQNDFEEKYNESLLNSININIKTGLYRATNDGLIYCTQSMVDMFGYSSIDELLNLPSRELYANESQFETLHSLSNLRKLNSSIEIEFKRKNGTTFWGLINIAVIKQDDDNILIDGSIIDISEKKESEKAIIKQNELLESIFDNSPFMISLFDPLQNKFILNRAFEEVTGTKKEEINIHSIASIIFETEDISQICTKYSTNFKDNYEIITSKNGSKVLIKSYNKVLNDGRIITIAQDVTENERLRNEITRYFELSKDIYIISNFDGELEYVTGAWEDILGYSIEETIGKHWYKFVLEDDIEHTINEIKRQFKEGSINFRFINRYKTKEGKIRWFEWNTILEKNENKTYSFVKDVTTDYDLKRELQKREELFGVLINNSLDLFTLVDSYGNIKFYSYRFFEDMGYTEAEILDIKLSEIVHSEDQARVNYILKGLVDNPNSSTQFTVKLCSKDNSILYYEISAKNLLQESNVEYIIINGRNVTERYYQEEKIIEQQRINNAILNSTENGFMLINKDGFIIYKNKSIEELILQISKININISKKFYDTTILIEKHKLKSCFEKALNGEIVSFIKHFSINSNNCYYLFKLLPVLDEYKQIFAVSLSITDITELKQNENVLNKSLEQTKALIEAIPDSIIRLDSKYTILEINPSLQDVLLLNKSYIGKKILTLPFPKDLLDEIVKYVNQALVIDVIFTKEYDFSDIYGKEKQVEFRITRSSEQEVLIILRDVTDQVLSKKKIRDLNLDLELKVQMRTAELQKVVSQLEYEVKQRKVAQEEAENAKNQLQISLQNEIELNELKTRFVAMVSHEYRTPLTVIQTSTYLLDKHFENYNKERFFTNLVKIQKAVENMVDLLENVLSFSKLETGKVERFIETTNLIEFIKIIIENNSTLSSASKNEINLISEKTELFIETDKKLLTQILNNLIFNAIKYSPEGGEVKVVIIDDGLQIRVDIIDKGIGINQDDILRLSQPFHRGKNVENISGTGLGLTISKAWLNILDGTLSIQSELGKGSTFSIRLPKFYMIH